MATKRYDLTVGKKGKDGRTYWKTIGVIFQNDKGNLSGLIELIPTGWDGWFCLFEPKERQGKPETGKDEIPF